MGLFDFFKKKDQPANPASSAGTATGDTASQTPTPASDSTPSFTGMNDTTPEMGGTVSQPTPPVDPTAPRAEGPVSSPLEGGSPSSMPGDTENKAVDAVKDFKDQGPTPPQQ